MEEDTITDVEIISSRYDDAMAMAGYAANLASQENTFDAYHTECSENTKRRQINDLKQFSLYLKEAGIHREVQDLFHDPEAWRGMSHGLLRGFQLWLAKQGYSTGSIGVMSATIRKYCLLAGPVPEGAGVLDADTLAMIQTVKSLQGKKAKRFDQDRQKQGIPTRKGHKKAEPTPLTTSQMLQLKKAQASPEHQPHRQRDKLLTARDQLIMGLILEHALRCEEVTLLDIEHINLQTGMIKIYTPKTHRDDTHKLMKHTRIAAEEYIRLLRLQNITSGPLFPGYKGARIKPRAINRRVQQIGEAAGIPHLSPHDGRHRWAIDALLNGTSLDRVQSGGRWNSANMVLHYAKITGIGNDGVKITEEEE